MVTDFLLFGATLACVAIFHRHTLAAALIGLGAIIVKKLAWEGFDGRRRASPASLPISRMNGCLLANLFLLLVGFALLARHFESSRVPDWMPAILPDDWTGRFRAPRPRCSWSPPSSTISPAALIGATVAEHVFKDRVRIGYLAAIVAAANAGGAGSVIGDTTTTMLWIGGVSPLSVFTAYVAAIARFSSPPSRHRSPNTDMRRSSRIRRAISALHSATLPSSSSCSAAAIAANVGANLARTRKSSIEVPLIGLAVAAALILMAPSPGRICRSFPARRAARSFFSLSSLRPR